jgi:hypothetical protein
MYMSFCILYYTYVVSFMCMSFAVAVQILVWLWGMGRESTPPPHPYCTVLCTEQFRNQHKITNVPVVYMGLDVWIWKGVNSFLGAFEGVGPEISTFLDPNGTRYARCHFRAKKVSISGPTPSNTPRYGQWWAAILKNVSFKAIQIHNF